MRIGKALSVVSGEWMWCTTDRGLQFSGNWFKNKVPHHPATHLWGLFLFFKIKLQLIILTNKSSKPSNFGITNKGKVYLFS